MCALCRKCLNSLRHLARPNPYELRYVSRSYADPTIQLVGCGPGGGGFSDISSSSVALKHLTHVRKQKLQSSDSAASQEGGNLPKQRVMVASKKRNEHSRVQNW